MSAPGVIPRLVALTDQGTYPDCIRQAEELCEQAQPHTVIVVLRDRNIPVRERLSAAERLRSVTHAYQQYLYVSDRVDLARIVAADGVHLPTNGFSPSACRTIWGGPILRAGHELETLQSDDWACVDMLLVSPVAEARKGQQALGERGLTQACASIRTKNEHLAVYALGGVTGENAETYMRAGASGVAAVSGVWVPERRDALLVALGISRDS